MTVIIREHCLPYVGQRVMVQTTGGATHDGILHTVTNDGIYMRPIAPGRAGLVCDVGKRTSIDVLKNIPQSADDNRNVFFPFLFFPFFALAAFRPYGYLW